jgi:hypothetical protein
MPVGDDATAAGYPLVPQTGTGGEVHNGYLEINRTRDFIAQVKNLIFSIWPLSSGGTGASSASGARSNLGIRSGTAAPSDAVGGSDDGNIYFQVL